MQDLKLSNTWLFLSVRNVTTRGRRWVGTTWLRCSGTSWQYIAMWGTCSISSARTTGSKTTWNFNIHQIYVVDFKSFGISKYYIYTWKYIFLNVVFPFYSFVSPTVNNKYNLFFMGRGGFWFKSLIKMVVWRHQNLFYLLNFKLVSKWQNSSWIF